MVYTATKECTDNLECARPRVDGTARGVQDGAVVLLNMLKKKLEHAPADQAILLTRMCGHYLNLTAIAEQHYMYAYTPPPVLLLCTACKLAARTLSPLNIVAARRDNFWVC